jgi:hypothetical protein
MSHALKLLSLLLLLITAQQGAVVHELGHLSGAGGPEIRLDAGVANLPCALCPAFAQAGSPAFGHSFHVTSMVRSAREPSSLPFIAVIEAAPPAPRSRGPPV